MMVKTEAQKIASEPWDSEMGREGCVPYLALEETGILHGAVWLVQLLVRVAHVLVPQPGLAPGRALKQQPHFLLYGV